MIYNILLIVQIIVSIGITTLVLMQHGKGADAGAAFGSGASGTVFGSQGSANFLSRATAILATVFFINSLALAWLVSGNNNSSFNSVLEGVQTEEVAPAQGEAPAAPTATQNTDTPSAPAAPAATETPSAPAAPAAPATTETPAAPAANGDATQQKSE